MFTATQMYITSRNVLSVDVSNVKTDIENKVCHRANQGFVSTTYSIPKNILVHDDAVQLLWNWLKDAGFETTFVEGTRTVEAHFKISWKGR